MQVIEQVRRHFAGVPMFSDRGEEFRVTLSAGIATCPVHVQPSQLNAAAQRALELEADILVKATRVDGVYSEDPEKNPHAVFYPELDYDAVREQNLGFMDSTAITHCMEHNMPILVFNFKQAGNIQRAVMGEKIGTYVGRKTDA